MGYIKEMSGSKRRSYLGIGVSNFNFNTSAGRLGTIDTVCHSALNQHSNEFFGSDSIPYDPWKMLRLSKKFLSLRSVKDYPELIKQLDDRKEWNKTRHVIETLLDVFTSLKFSHSTLHPKAYSKGIVDVRRSVETGNTFIADIERSHSIRLDPVDSPKELAKYRLRIQRIIDWSYKVDLVPVMMTLTMFHRWDYLAPLCRALRLAWSELFGSGQAGYNRKLHIGLQGFIRRMEETLNDGSEFAIDDNNNLVSSSLGNVSSEVVTSGGGSVAAARNDLSNDPHSDAVRLTNAGWHPHYHVILFIPRDKLQTLSEYEETLQEVWVELVSKYYKKEVGKEIPASYYDAFKKHGLVLSRYKSEEHAKRCGNRRGKTGDLLEVKDGKYLAKMLGYDSPEVFGGDSEMTSFNAKSNLNANGTVKRIGGKIPFDLLCEKQTASNIDLWCEYAIATKGIPCFTFSKGLEKMVNAYYKEHPNEEYTKVSYSTNPSNAVTVGSFAREDYKKIYRHSQSGNMLEIAKSGFEKLSEWAKDTLGILCFKPSADECSSENINPSADKDKKFLLSSKTATNSNPIVSVDEDDLAVAKKMESDVYNTYGVHLIPLVSNGLSIDDAINSLSLTDAQKETLVSFAMCYKANIIKSRERMEELQHNLSPSSEPPPDITDSYQYEQWAEREFKKQQTYQAVANDSNLSSENKEKILRLLDEYYSNSP